jgi:release factor glutamine methyltransferase
VATAGELLSAAVERLREAGSETPRLDAEVLLAAAIGTDRTTLLAHPDVPVGPGPAERFEEGIARRSRGEPVAYIRGVKEFYGLAFGVDERALIPRPESERLVEAGLAAVMHCLVASGGRKERQPVGLVDVGTGSGAIVISVAVDLRRRRVDLGRDVELRATDVSAESLSLARENAVGHAVADAIDFVETDLLPLDGPMHGGGIDVILANLPYVRSDAIATLPIAASFEPRIALDGGADGLEIVRRLLGRLPAALAGGGVALLEIGADHGVAAPAAVAEVLPGWSASVENDLAGLPRVLRVTRVGAGVA